jgi:uncharacterized protein YgbK (DUF1537 family)
MGDGATRLAFYGDDLTGSTDALEGMARGGFRAALFLSAPTEAALAQAGRPEIVGVAGVSRAKSPEWMRAELPGVFAALRALEPAVLQYKVCSTFDSAPTVGNIGTVLEIALGMGFGPRVPIVVGVPRNGRYTAFGHLFATVSGSAAAHRIDRHPVMARHPRTPMGEADLVRHMAALTSVPVDLVDFREVAAGRLADRLAEAGPRGGVLIDCLDAVTERAIGVALADPRLARPIFAIASSGLNHAVMAAAERPAAAFAPPGAVEAMLAVSGSCSPATARQMDEAEAAGWLMIEASADALLADAEAEIARLGALAGAALERGRSACVTTARRPDAADAALIAAAAEAMGLDTGEAFGAALGRLVHDIVTARPALRRVIVAGGDTSSFAGLAMGIEALAVKAPIAHGSPLCAVTAGAPRALGLEVNFKGGQLGPPDHFERVRLGQPLPGL